MNSAVKFPKNRFLFSNTAFFRLGTNIALNIFMHFKHYRSSIIDMVEIVSLYQPLYSVHEKKYIGVEALSRGIYKGRHLNAAQLFSLPNNEKENLALNKKCIQASLRNMKSHADSRKYSIFLNIDSSLMDNPEFSNDMFNITTSDTDIESDQIVIELIENRVKNFDVFLNFVSYCREQGFLIALDDVGAGYSSLERIVKIKPDIIKIDRALVNGVSEEFHKREVCRSLIELAHNIGTLSLAEGVETLPDALECQELGADIMQGFYFSKPLEQILPIDSSAGKISLLVETWNFSATERNNNLRNSLERVKKQAAVIYEALLTGRKTDWDDILISRVDAMPDIECAYILDSRGKQLSISALRTNYHYRKHKLFTPAKPGADHSQKYYFLRRAGNQKWYISDPYISCATGNICRTVSMLFRDIESTPFYLCLDINN